MSVCPSSWHEGVLTHYTPKSGLVNHDPVPWVVASVLRFTIQWHLWVVMLFPQPNTHVPPWHLQPCHSTCGLHPSSVDALVDVHGRSHNLPLIHPREVLLVGHWVATLPMFSCGIISVSPPVEVGLHGVGLVHLFHAWWMPIHKGTPTSDAMRRSWFWWRMCGSSALVHHFVRGDICCDLMHHSHVCSSLLSLIFLFPLEPSAFTSTRLPGFRFMVPIFLSLYHFCWHASAVN